MKPVKREGTIRQWTWNYWHVEVGHSTDFAPKLANSCNQLSHLFWLLTFQLKSSMEEYMIWGN
jgi:hypothetical protein